MYVQMCAHTRVAVLCLISHNTIVTATIGRVFDYCVYDVKSSLSQGDVVPPDAPLPLLVVLVPLFAVELLLLLFRLLPG